jgi:hypothetical protein
MIEDNDEETNLNDTLKDTGYKVVKSSLNIYLLIFGLGFLALSGVIYYLGVNDKFKGMVSNICEPNINLTCAGDSVNLTCPQSPDVQLECANSYINVTCIAPTSIIINITNITI